jgi:four helix bundle protein
MKENILKDKSLSLAIRVLNLYKFLSENKKEFVLSKQILRSGTSVEAMIREAEFSESNLDFIHKLSIAQKEINETIYWLELMFETKYITIEQFESITSNAIEIIKLITSSIKTVKSKQNKIYH